jgi:hypothetical protein
MPKGGTWFECPQPASLESLSNLFTHPR